jgi:predicted nucleotidyltransferase
MDVSMPITTVAPSLDGPVLAALTASTTPISLAEVHTRSRRGSKSGIRSVLLRLVEAGLVLEVPGGYVLNRYHLAAPAVELLAALHGELANRIRSEVEEWSTAPSLVGIYGSAARRDGDTNSDIDVLVVSDAPDLDDRVDELAERIRLWTGNRAQVVGRTPNEISELRRSNEPIIAEWARELIVIVGKRNSLAELA